MREWLLQKDLTCIEEGFEDLAATGARYPDGTQKLVSFLGGAADFIDASDGMTEVEIDDFIQSWRARYPDSLLAELLWPRLLVAAAWHERGSDWAENVAPDRMREFRRLSAAALHRTQSLSPAAREHLLGRYVSLRVLADDGGSVDEIKGSALASLSRFPQETGLAVIAGERMLPKWGASPTDFEDFARAARDAVGPGLADRTYASLYVQVVGFEQFHLHPQAGLASVKAGLMELATLGTFDGILTLQHFACAQHDAEALRRARSLWGAYAAEPQLRGPQTELDARCREWERSLPTVSQPTPAPTKAMAVSQAGPVAANLFNPAAPPEVARTFYDVRAESWDRLNTPAGEVFTCKSCEYPVQVSIAVGPSLSAGAEFTNNERFLALLDSPERQGRAAREHTEQSAQLDPASSKDILTIVRTGFAEVDGFNAFQYEATVHLRRGTLRETVLELVRRGRMLRIAVHRFEGPSGSKEQEAVAALIRSVRLRNE